MTTNRFFKKTVLLCLSLAYLMACISCYKKTDMLYMGLKIYTCIDNESIPIKTLTLRDPNSYTFGRQKKDLHYFQLCNISDSMIVSGICFTQENHLFLRPRIRYFKVGDSIAIDCHNSNDASWSNAITFEISKNGLTNTKNAEFFFKVEADLPYPIFLLNGHRRGRSIAEWYFSRHEYRMLKNDKQQKSKGEYINEDQL